MSDKLSTGHAHNAFTNLIDNADDAVQNFIAAHTGAVDANGNFVQSPDGTLVLSASDSMQLQQLMAEQSIAANAGTNTLKTVKDSILAAARNI